MAYLTMFCFERKYYTERKVLQVWSLKVKPKKLIKLEMEQKNWTMQESSITAVKYKRAESTRAE